MDPNAARILARWLDEPDRYPDEPEYPGDPRIHPETQWRLLNRYFDEDFKRATNPDDEQHNPVRPIEALTLARLLSESLRGAYWGLIYESRQAGHSWATIGAALGISRQAAWEMYQKDIDKSPMLPFMNRDKYRSVLDDQPTTQTEPKETTSD